MPTWDSITLEKGESKQVHRIIDTPELSLLKPGYYDITLEFIVEKDNIQYFTGEFYYLCFEEILRSNKEALIELQERKNKVEQKKKLPIWIGEIISNTITQAINLTNVPATDSGDSKDKK
jgi:hypothetical protein